MGIRYYIEWNIDVENVLKVEGRSTSTSACIG